MLAAPKATAPPRNLPRITSETKTPFYSAPRRHKQCLLIILSELKRQRDSIRTIRKVGMIKIVAIAAPTGPGLRVLPRPLESIRPRPWLEMIMAATSQRVGKIKTWAGTPVTSVTKRPILPTNVLSPVSQKTSIGLGNLFVGDWC